MHLRMQNSTVSLAALGLLSVAVALATLGTGCGSKGDAETSTIPTSSPMATQVAQATVPQADQELVFSQIVPKCKTVSDGQVVHYRFSYADRDGKVHFCDLPKAMSEGRWTRSAWQCTFQAYEVCRPAKESRRVAEYPAVPIYDLPIVSPTPERKQAAAKSSVDPNDPDYHPMFGDSPLPSENEISAMVEADIKADTAWRNANPGKCVDCRGTGKSNKKNALGNFEDCSYCRGTGNNL